MKLISHEKFKSMCPGPLFVYTTMYHQEKEEVLQYYLILPRKVLFDSFVKKKLRIDYEHFLFSCFEIKNTSLLCNNFEYFQVFDDPEPVTLWHNEEFRRFTLGRRIKM